MGLGYVEGVTHNYFRHGTTTLFAALDIANGTVIGQCKARHRHQELLSFLNHLEKSVPAALDVHLVMDNYGTHKHPKVRAWFARRPRFHVHFTPTYASWLNQVERWFGLISQRAIKRGSFRKVKELIARIEHYIAQHNANPVPFAWTATTDSILKNSPDFRNSFAGQHTSGLLEIAIASPLEFVFVLIFARPISVIRP